MTARLYLLQRATALILAPLVLVHLALIVFAVRNGLSAEEILARTRGSLGWAGFYGLFVVTAAIHGGIGLRTVLIEWTGLKAKAASGVAGPAIVFLIALGLYAVGAVTAGGAP